MRPSNRECDCAASGPDTGRESVEDRNPAAAHPVAGPGAARDPPSMAAIATIRVLVCDDHALVRSGLCRLLESEPAFDVVGEAADADQAVECVADLQPDVLLLDVVMPGRSGIDALADLREASPQTRVLVLSMQDDPRYVRHAFAAGAHGYLVKEAADADLVQAIEAVAAGHRYVHPSLGARLATVDVEAHGRAATDPLSEREHEVLRLLALGHTNQEIAKLLFISVRTAESHRARIMQKLELSSRAELVRYALASGELQLDAARTA
jgi:two-component system response regulator NreC